MSDFRLALAQEVSEQIGADVLAEACPKCRTNLMMKKEQGLPFCWFCVTDKMAAQRAQTTLTKARMASQGMVIGWETNFTPMDVTPPSEDQSSSWLQGWAI